MSPKLYLINTNIFLLKKSLPVIYIGLCFFWLTLLDGPHGTQGYLAKVDGPLWMYVVSVITLIISFILALTSSFMNHLVKEDRYLIFHEESVKLYPSGNKIDLKNVRKIELLLDASSIKRFKNREATTGGGNNWIILHQSQSIEKFEIYIESKRMEEDLLEFLNSLNLTFEVGKSQNSLLLSLVQW